jgi:hypothetical protein
MEHFDDEPKRIVVEILVRLIIVGRGKPPA